MNQLTLFDEPAWLSRQSDPASSKEAAVAIRPKLQKAKEAFILALEDLGGIRTAREIGERAKEMGLHSEVETIRKRSAELERLRLIEVAGMQRCSVTGKLAEGWRLAGE